MEKDFSEVFVRTEDLKTRQDNAIMDGIHLYLSVHCRGHENVITADELALHIPGLENKANAAVRKYIKATGHRDCMAIVSCSRGFYVPTCEKDMEKYRAHMNKRIAEIQADIAFNDEMFAASRAEW